MRKICVFTASRAEYGLLKRLLFLLKNQDDIKLQLLVSGGHLAISQGNTISEIIQDGFSPDATAEILLDSDSSTSVCLSMGIAMQQFGLHLNSLRPDMVVLLGDRYETFIAAAAAAVLCIPVAHLHGGEITQGAIDDIFRHAITKMSHWHFCSCEPYRQRVIQLGEEPERVWNVGAPGVENALKQPLMPQEDLYACLNLPPNTPYFLCTFHPVTLEHGQESIQFQALCQALDHFPEHRIIFTGANADHGGGQINRLLHSYVKQYPDRVQVYQSLGCLRYLSAAKYAAAVVGNSSSGVIEIPSLGTPVVNIGDRQKGRIASSAVLHCPPVADAIVSCLEQALTAVHREKAKSASNPYERPNTSQRIAEILTTYPLTTVLKKKFYDLPA